MQKYDVNNTGGSGGSGGAGYIYCPYITIIRRTTTYSEITSQKEINKVQKLLLKILLCAVVLYAVGMTVMVHVIK